MSREDGKLSPAELAKLAASGAVVKWKFDDGEVMGVPLAEVIAIENDQLHALIEMQREAQERAKLRQKEVYEASDAKKREIMQTAIDAVERGLKEQVRKNIEAIERNPNTPPMKRVPLTEKRRMAADYLRRQGCRGFSLREFEREKIKPS